MVAFVAPAAAPIASSTSRFVTGTSKVTTNDSTSSKPAANSRTAKTTTMKVLDGLDTVNQDSYTFSRYILGPFQPTVLYGNSSDGDREIAIRAAYRHIFGNAYIMEEEREELGVAESQFKLGALTAKEFVRAIGKSSAYKTRFFEGASQYRFVELNYLHFLGRAPDSQQEISEHIQRYCSSGVDADIDSYIDSEEYSSVFGDYNIPFLRFRGAYTPCDSFNKQCALKGGWANSDKAMGGAALSGFNGSDGRQMCDRIAAYATDEPTPFVEVAKNSPLLTTAPNWVAYPDPAVPPSPPFVSEVEVKNLAARVKELQEQYDEAIERKNNGGKDTLAPFRAMVAEMAPMLDRGFAYEVEAMANPDARLASDSSALADIGYKSTDYERYSYNMDSDTVSRLERDLEEARAQLRVLSDVLSKNTPMSETDALPFLSTSTVGPADSSAEAQRPKILTIPGQKTVAEDPTDDRLITFIIPILKITISFRKPF